jgi:hypothetical protein
LSGSSRRHQLIALLAAVALLFCGVLYAGHGLGDRSHEHEHCDLCVHLAGTAGTPAAAKAVGRPAPVAWVAAAPAAQGVLPSYPTGLYLSRAPPQPLTHST